MWLRAPSENHLRVTWWKRDIFSGWKNKFSHAIFSVKKNERWTLVRGPFAKGHFLRCSRTGKIRFGYLNRNSKRKKTFRPWKSFQNSGVGYWVVEVQEFLESRVQEFLEKSGLDIWTEIQNAKNISTLEKFFKILEWVFETWCARKFKNGDLIT